MDHRIFDDLTRSIATKSDRRRVLRLGLAAVAAVAGLARLDPASAARRGYTGQVTICKPDGAGGYRRVSVPAGTVAGHLATGSLPDNGCCANLDCTGGDTCSTAVCNPHTGACQHTPVADGTECTYPGPPDLCYPPATCQSGICTRGMRAICPSYAGGCIQSLGCNPATGQCDTGPSPDGTRCFRDEGCVQGTCANGICLDPPVRDCGGDACRLCGYDSCLDACICVAVACSGDPDCQNSSCDPEIGCVYQPIREGEPCGGGSGTCVDGVCTAVVPT